MQVKLPVPMQRWLWELASKRDGTNEKALWSSMLCQTELLTGTWALFIVSKHMESAAEFF